MSLLGIITMITLKVSLILGFGLVSVVCLRRRSAEVRHWVLTVAVVSACAAPFVGGVVPSWQVVRWPGPVVMEWARQANFAPAAVSEPARERTEVVSQRRAAQTAAPTALRAAGSVAPVRRPTLPPGVVVLAVWVAGTVATGLRLLFGLVRLKRLSRNARRVTVGPMSQLCARLSKGLGVRRRVDVLQSEHPALLVTWGWIRPKVMLPAPAVEWSEERLRVVLSHELAHVSRHDWAIQMLGEGLRCVFWFNPLVWLTCVQMRRESELACDDVVLSVGVTGHTYAIHLLALARAVRTHHREWVPAPAMARPSNLERRVTAMLNPHLDRSCVTRVGRIAAVGAAVGVAVVVSSLTLGAQSASYSGVVIDQAGHPIPMPTLRLTDRETRDQQSVAGDETRTLCDRGPRSWNL